MTYGHWLRLPLPVRNDVAQAFGITKTGPTHVSNNQIQSDGYQVHDIETAITVPKLQEFLGSKETDMNVLWEQMVDKVEGRVPAEIPMVSVLAVPKAKKTTKKLIKSKKK